MSSKYTEEFKKHIVELRMSGKRMVDLCRDYQLGKNTITDWVRRYSKSGKFSKYDNLSAEEKEILRLKKENKALKLELDVLKQLALVLEMKGKGK